MADEVKPRPDQQHTQRGGRQAQPAPKEFPPEVPEGVPYTPQERTEESQESGKGRRMVRGNENK